ncbi:MAG: alpha-2-macroglobulin, partial [Abditibacteriota bacterium]|nr:alpha-2-macroglobulin [Abditibacteriota bacterium]
FTQFLENFGAIEEATKVLGAPVATWNFKPKDKHDHQQVMETIDTPVDDMGAYIIVARTPNLRAANVLLISDLAILKKVDRDNAFAFVADAKSGEPIQNARVVLKETYYNDNSNSLAHATSGLSSEIGIFEKKRVRGNVRQANRRVAAFAWIGNRYAMTGNYDRDDYGNDRESWKIYAYTDRPVYRPGQKVYFREIITHAVKGGDQAPAKNRKIKVTVSNPKGETIFDKVLSSSEFGTVNGELDLPAETPLGEYSINAQVLNDKAEGIAAGGNRFRVEEYKRPEFEVTIDAPDVAVRPGETVAAKINAKYYFGSPVPNATVKYTVRRSSWWTSYRWPSRSDWLIDFWSGGRYNTGLRNIGGEGSGAIVKEGTAQTDAQGNAEVSFTATKDAVDDRGDGDNWWWRRYSNPLYVIEAEVTDASRRTIEGSGSVKVANQQYFAYLDAKRGYYIAGDRVQIEVATRDANDKAVSVAGKMVIYKLLPGNKEERIFEEAVQTDAQGRLFWTWPSDNAGHFRIAWEATDAWNQKVVGSTQIWIGGPQLNQTQFRLQGVTIVLDKRTYEEGETAKVLLVADQPDTTVLLTQETGGDILKRDVIHIAGKSREIEIPIRHANVPNFAIAAALVKNYEIFQAQQEVFVPPVGQLINVSVSGQKESYKPGEKAVFKLNATDWKGNPVRAEISMALTDASLFYIQKDYAPDIRPFFYGERRYLHVQLDSHRSGKPEPRLEEDIKYLQAEAHEWVLPDEFGQLNQDPSGGFGYYGRYGGRQRSGFGMAGGMGGGMPEGRIVAAMPASGAVSEMAADTATSSNAPPRSLARRKSASLQDASESTLQTAQVRSNFAETAFWAPAVVTENGQAQVEVTFPDTLTQWRATARGLTQEAQVGAAQTDVETKKNLLVRMQAPRFFVERDQVVLTANVHNYLKTDKRVKVALKTDDALKLNSTRIEPASSGHSMSAFDGWVDVKAGEELRVNWTVDVVKDGDVSVQMTAQSDEESDAVKMQFPVLVHGVQRFTAQSGVLREANKQTISIDVPKERRVGASTLNVQVNPSMAATMLDALPYLADYPYGCVEQTMSRFLPAVVVAKTLSDSGVNLSTLRTRAQAYAAESKTQAVGERIKNTGYTYPTGMPNARDLEQMASRLWYTDRRDNPVFDDKVLSSMVSEGLNRLYAMQRSDGGWGWWPGSAESDEYMSAYVVYGLATARAAEVDVRAQVLSRGFAYLEAQMKNEDNIHLLTALAHSLSMRGQMPNDVRQIVSGRLFDQRERLTAYSKSLLAMALWNIGEKEKAAVVVRNLENTAKVDAENGTARWQNGNQWWFWWNNDVETNAVALRAFLLVDPQNTLVPQMMKWLATQARGNHWRSTKETAMAVYALADYVRINRELDVDYTIRIALNNKIARSYRVTSENALYFDNRFITGDLFLQDGANTVTIEKQGRGNIYWSAASEYFSLEEPIKASGNQIAIKRRFFKLTRSANVKAEQAEQSTLAAPATAARRKVAGIMPPRPIAKPSEPEFDRSEIADGAQLQSGDLVEVELIVDAKNDYEYLVFEDMKAAGLEPVDIRSGSSWGDGLSSNVELRDEKVAFFVDRLPQGTRVLRYRMRAEIPGRFHALPTNGYAMYAPEVRAISDEQRMNVRD